MENTSSSNNRNKFYWLIGFLVLLVVVVVVLNYSYKSFRNKSSSDSSGIEVPKKMSVNKQELPNETLPDRFPKDFPVEKDVAVEQNYNSVSDKGNFQATRSYKSAMTLEQNEKVFMDYFKSNGWSIGAKHNDTNVVAISAIKDSVNIVVTVNNIVEDNSVSVNLTLVEAPKL